MKTVLISTVAAGLALAILGLAPAQAEPARCLPAGHAIDEMRAARPSTVVMAQHDGPAAAAIGAAMGSFVTNNEVPAADEIAVLYSRSTNTVLLIGSADGCLRWRGVFPLATYEDVLRQALGVST